jgi:hypothetical protein
LAGGVIVALTDSVVTVTQYLYDLLKDNAVSGFSETIDSDLVFWGDQNRLPGYPALCVEAGPKTRELTGALRQTQNNITVYIIVYHGEVASTQSNRKLSEQLAESIETVIHGDPYLGDNVIHSFVSEMVPGYVVRGTSPVVATRLTVSCLTKTRLG